MRRSEDSEILIAVYGYSWRFTVPGFLFRDEQAPTSPEQYQYSRLGPAGRVVCRLGVVYQSGVLL